MSALTNEDIAYTPVINMEDATDMKRGILNRHQLALCIVLVINIVIQFIAIVTPGWSILTTNTLSAYESVYYATACVKYATANESDWECKTRSFHDTFHHDYNDATDGRKPALVLQNNLRVRYQMNVQISWIIVAVTTLLQYVRHTRTKELFPKLTVISTLFLMIACGFMYQALYEAFASIDFSRRRSEYYGEVGFPYSVLLYSISFVLTCASTFLIVKQTLDYMRYVQQSLDEYQTKYDSLKKYCVAEVEKFSHYRDTHPDITPSHVHNGESNNEDRHSYSHPSPRNPERPSPRTSQRLSPRQTDNIAQSRYLELLERARAEEDEHVASIDVEK
ncbi:uncharacterized protein LOC123550646 [Mercenaria mercenaria]|uniref:uncharacterized protein LOC123550646 n=1 Tax=Mercenaria mercenaria TaxID=6596 RepID=UPI00234F297C|nr:uncharacterized protein LOC123550646 [Mercenaria mercenaria]